MTEVWYTDMKQYEKMNSKTGDVIVMRRKWLFRGIIVCIIAVVGFLAYMGIAPLLTDSQPDEALGDSISEVVREPAESASEDSVVDLFEKSVPLSGYSGQDVNPALREYAVKVIELVNEERAKAGAGPLSESDLLYSAASVRALELQTLFSHNRPDGSLCFTVYSDFNISCKARAENIAAGHKSPEIVVDAWMKSDGHRTNMLNPDYNNIGVGVSQEPSGKLSWVQLFSD